MALRTHYFQQVAPSVPQQQEQRRENDTRSADDTRKEMAGALEAPKKEDPVTVCPFETVPHDLKSTRKATKKIVKKKEPLDQTQKFFNNYSDNPHL